MAIMTHAKFHFNRLMLTLIFGIWACPSPRAWRTTERPGLIVLNEMIIGDKKLEIRDSIGRSFNLVHLCRKLTVIYKLNWFRVPAAPFKMIRTHQIDRGPVYNSNLRP